MVRLPLANSWRTAVHTFQSLNFDDRSQISVLSYDYRGYGLHGGVPTEPSCYADIEGVYDYMINELKIPPARIILYVHSFARMLKKDNLLVI